MSISVLSILSLMFGVFGMCLSCIFIGIFPCILSVILGCIALKDDMTYKWPSICGIVCSAVGIIMAVVVMTQSESYNTPNVATPTEIVQNITSSNESNQDSISDYKEQNSTVVEKSNNIVAEPSTNSNIIDMNFDSFSATYVSYELSTDYEGNSCVIIYYDFTNNSDDPQSALTTTYMQVFQNGVQCDNAIVFEGNDYLDNYSKNVTQGTKIRVGQAFSISDMSDIDVIMKEAFSFSNKSDEMVIKLN